jgi:tetratricopeptide (TPR) repeat protein
MRKLAIVSLFAVALAASAQAQSFTDYLGGWAQDAAACASGPQVTILGGPSRTMTFRHKGSPDRRMVSTPSSDPVEDVVLIVVEGSGSAAVRAKVAGGKLTVTNTPRRGDIAISLGGVPLALGQSATLVACDAAVLSNAKIWAECESHPNPVSADVQERSCTALIDAGLRKPDELMAAYANRSTARRNRGNADDAVTDGFGAVQFAPKSPIALYVRGLAWHAKGRYDLAFKDFNDAVILKPDYATGYWGQGYALEFLGKFDQAEDAYSDAIKLNPGDAGNWNSRGWVRAMANKKLDDALGDVNRALSLNPNYANAYDTRALVNFRMGKFDAAVQDAGKSLAINAKMPTSLYLRGLAKRRLGQTAEGDVDLAAARAMDAKVVEEFKRAGLEP